MESRDDAGRIKAELNQVRQELDNLAKEYAILSSKISIRRIELKAAGISAKTKNTPDELLKGMIDHASEMIVEIRSLKKRRQQLLKAVPPKPKKPRGERPINHVYMGREFYDCNGYERRLALLMAMEIGQKRYDELKRQAADDTSRGETYFYTGTTVTRRWDDACRKSEVEQIGEDFERLMRTNFNRFSGEEI